MFAGEQFDQGLGDYYLRQRYYDTYIGRFTRRDSFEGTLEDPLTLHKYSYGYNNPSNLVDPSGLSPSPLSKFFQDYGNTVLKNFQSGLDRYIRIMNFGSMVGARIRRDIKQNHPDHEILGEFPLEGAGKKPDTDGKADIIRVLPSGVYELYEIKPLDGDPAGPQLTKYLAALTGLNYNATLGTYPYSGQFDNDPVVGVRINYNLSGPGKIVYYPSINEIGQAMAVLVAGIYTISQINALQFGRLAGRVAEQVGLQRGFLF